MKLLLPSNNGVQHLSNGNSVEVPLCWVPKNVDSSYISSPLLLKAPFVEPRQFLAQVSYKWQEGIGGSSAPAWQEHASGSHGRSAQYRFFVSIVRWRRGSPSFGQQPVKLVGEPTLVLARVKVTPSRTPVTLLEALVALMPLSLNSASWAA